MNPKSSFIYRVRNYSILITTITMAYFTYYLQRLRKSLQDPNNHEARRLHSKRVDYLSNRQLPNYVLTPLLEMYSSLTGADQKDLIKPLQKFTSFQDFFTREVKPRKIIEDKTALLAPADSRVLSIEKVDNDKVLSVKGSTYSLCHFLTNDVNCQWQEKELGGLKKKTGNQLYSLIFYLSPGDYHRFHSPSDIIVREFEHFKGDTQLVEPGNLMRNPVS